MNNLCVVSQHFFKLFWIVIPIYLNNLCITNCDALNSFVASFQTDGKWSTNDWMRYNEKVEKVDNELTVCHWEKIRYFSAAVNSVWAYCFIISEDIADEDLRCWQLYSEANRASSGRSVNLIITTSSSSIVAENVPYKHREWNHFCFTYSTTEKYGKLYANGKLLKAVWQGDFNRIPSGDEVLRSSFVIGQEPDRFNGGYDSAQLFNGEIAELNMWNTALSKRQVEKLSNCSLHTKGNIIAWEENRFIMNQVRTEKLKSLSEFCNRNKELIIFPEKRSFEDAKNLCDIHGGQLVVPRNAKEERNIIDVLNIHKSSCLDFSNEIQDDKAVWLGMERKDKEWYVPEAESQHVPINYTNWNSTYCTREECGPSNLSCPYMLKDGLWAFGLHWGTCSATKLCTICSLSSTPMFTLKGVCGKNAHLDWNYYLATNQRHEVIGYNGFKTSNLTYENGIWTFQDIETLAETRSEYPIGRMYWSYKDSSCGIKSSVKTSLAFSKCHFGKEFTCNSGQCISMSQRCNRIKDCKDDSDEEMCDMIHIPSSYNKLHPPLAQSDTGDALSMLKTQINIISIDDIDSLNMQIVVTFELQLKWNDARLNFENLDTTAVNPMSEETARNIWMPSEHIIHDNAILGKIIEDPHRELGIENQTAAMPGDIMNSIENFVHLGSKTQIVLKQRFKITYPCEFDLAKFPFDEHKCSFILKLRLQNNDSILFAKDEPAILYNGPKTVNQFTLDKMASETRHASRSTNFIMNIQIHRNLMNSVLGTFVPTSLLWSLSYFTLFIDINDFSDRFIGAVTTLLVLVALLNAKNEELPKTSYFKFIDLWFLWYISSILIITVFHIFTNHITNENVSISQKLSPREKVNRFGLFFFGLTTIIFDVVYFHLTS